MPPPGTQRLDVNDPKDVQYLVDTGLAWRSGPQTMQVILRHIADGAVTRKPEREPPEVRSYLDKLAAPEEEPATPPDGSVQPVEQPEVLPVEPPVADSA